METLFDDRTYEAISAMQKCIRRGLEADAMYWALEVVEVSSGKGFYWMANRIRVTAYEDIGLADPAAVTFAIQSVNQACEWWKKKKDSWRLCIGAAILALSRADKSRECNEFQAAVRYDRLHEAEPREVFDFALDKHTRRGKAKGRGLDHFLKEGARLVPDCTPDTYTEKAAAWWGEAGE